MGVCMHAGTYILMLYIFLHLEAGSLSLQIPGRLVLKLVLKVPKYLRGLGRCSVSEVSFSVLLSVLAFLTCDIQQEHVKLNSALFTFIKKFSWVYEYVNSFMNIYVNYF